MTQKRYWSPVERKSRRRGDSIDNQNRHPRQVEPGIRCKIYNIYKEKGIDEVEKFVNNLRRRYEKVCYKVACTRNI